MTEINDRKRMGAAKTMFSSFMLIFLVAVLCRTAAAQCNSGDYQVEGKSAAYLICVPPGWNGDLVVFAHGYVSPTEPLAIVDNVVPPSGLTVSQIVTGMGYAFATTSYRFNGLVIPQAVEDIRELASQFPLLSGTYASPRHVYLIGASEGSLVTALALEKYREFSGGLAACGPVGDFKKQIDYFGDFLVLFNYFFPGVFSPFSSSSVTPEHIPVELLGQWDGIQLAVHAAITARPSAVKQLLRVANAATDPNDPLSEATILGVLWYNIFATNDAVERLGGHPYDNSRRWYSGSNNDLLLNLRVKRFRADSQALQNIDKGFQTTGRLLDPMVSLHTTADPIVPYWHETIYNVKVLLAGSLLRHLNLPVVGYGHCSFDQNELLTAFSILQFMAAVQ
jgi:pimeloyl-ACP methyl ester carboxylesterase